VIRWHRAGFRAYWRWKSRPVGGRPKTPADIRQLIRDMSIANPLWGAPRIHGELLKLGIDVGQTTVAKYMARRRQPPSQGWKTFLRNHADGIASMDLFVVPTISHRRGAQGAPRDPAPPAAWPRWGCGGGSSVALVRRRSPGTVTLPLCSRTNASPFWIMLLLVSGSTDHGIIVPDRRWRSPALICVWFRHRCQSRRVSPHPVIGIMPAS
jgi:hypothetical protein